MSDTIKIGDHEVSSDILERYCRVVRFINKNNIFELGSEYGKRRVAIHKEMLKSIGVKRFTDEGRDFNIVLSIYMNDNCLNYL